MNVLLRSLDLSDEYIRFAAQIGADGFDMHTPERVPGVAEQGYVDAAGLKVLLERLRRWGLSVFRVAPPSPQRYLLGEAGGDREVDDLCRSLEALGQAGVPFMSMPVHLEHPPGYRGLIQATHRGGYRMVGFDLATMRRSLAERPYEPPVDVEAHYARAVRLYQRLVPIAENVGVRLILHPADVPLPEAEFAPLRWSRILDDVPSDCNGLLYCIGTCYATGVNIHDEIRAFARRGKIFHVHLRNVRGTIPSSGGYEEVAMHDGDMNMAAVLRTLLATGYRGAVQIDHLPTYDGDNAFQGAAAAYAVGYVKALLVALDIT